MSTGGSYDPTGVEAEMYGLWEAGDYFHAEPDETREPYSIVIPPPNVTGALHLGHALNNTLQDVLIRRARMRGFNTCWLPGTDHAGIATQAVVEKRLKEEENQTRHEIGREALVQRIWDWKDDYNARIINQLRKMGCSCDWQRTRFTLDEVCAKAVYETFFRFFKDGLIFRGLRLVNWDAHLQTAVADDEIVHETVKGSLWHYRYPILEGHAAAEEHADANSRRHGTHDVAADARGLSDDDAKAAIARATKPDAQLGVDYLSVATTRPETMLGDTALAVHPDDERYKHLIGGRVMLPLQNRTIPVIADGLLVKQEFGTGCVKVTPAHDPNDYACGQRQGLEMINILTPEGLINDNGGAYEGMDRYDARKKVVADLEALGLLEQTEPYETEIGHSDRSKTPIEPMLSEQWFVKMDELAEPALEAVRDGRVRFFPERYAKTYLDWLGEKRDWCISRQLWWGHRIPVWTVPAAVAGVFDEGRDQRKRSTIDELGAALREYFAAAGVTEDSYVVEQPNEFTFRVCGGSNRARRALAALEEFYEGFRLEKVERGQAPKTAPKFVDGFREATPAAHRILTKSYFVRQDPDVLDTWFSSALWPHSTFGWPGEEEGLRESGSKGLRESGTKGLREGDASAPSIPQSLNPSIPTLNYFYPTNVLCTARDIISLWVARMVMTGLYNVGSVPFPHVYIHPVIQDGQGRRMSKSLGNGVDPLELIEMYGTDAMRFTLAQLAGETQDIRIPVKQLKLDDGRMINTSERFELGRNFCNKLWQAATGFVMGNLSGYAPKPLTPADLTLEDRWILSRLTACIEEVDRRLEQYQFSDACNALYAFFWSDFCDWYVELAKPRLFERDEQGEFITRSDESAQVARQVLVWVLDQTLRLLHPVVPFITEKLWHMLNEAAPVRGLTQVGEHGPALIVAAWPDAAAWPRDEQAETDIEALRDVIRALRDTRNRVNGIRAAARQTVLKSLPKGVIKAKMAIAEALRESSAMICRLGQCDEVEIGPDATKPPDAATQVFHGIEVYVSLTGLADLAIERKRLGKERDETATQIQRLDGKLANEGFVSKAPPEVVEKERERPGQAAGEAGGG